MSFNKMSQLEGSKNESRTSVEYTIPKFNVHKFMEEITSRNICFQVIQMFDSVFIFINEKDGNQFNDLSLAMKNKYSETPIGTRLLGNFTEDGSQNMASRISKKVGKAVYLSCNIDFDKWLYPSMEKRLYDEISAHPDKF